MVKLIKSDEEATVTTTANSRPAADRALPGSGVATKSDVDDDSRTGVIAIVVGVLGLAAAGVAIGLARMRVMKGR